MGLDLKWVEGVSDQELTEALFRCRRAHLLYEMKDKNIPMNEIPRKRAEYLHKLLSKITLKI
ncbi:MAG: protein arginine kinase, partial [Chlamydiales bacterium]|nr:protein arginine kinase [Chlamydiales bacterium]